MALKLADIHHGIQEHRLGLVGHVGRRSREAPVQPVGMTAYGDGSIALGAFAARHDFGIGGVEVAPLTGYHTYLIALCVAVVLVLNLPHRKHVWQFLLAHLCIFLRTFRGWAVHGGELHLVRAFENGVLGLHVIGMAE